MDLLDLLKSVTPKDKEEDVVPYDEQSGTLMNIGRYMLNNAAKDPGYAGMMPVAGALKGVPKAAGYFENQIANAAKNEVSRAAPVEALNQFAGQDLGVQFANQAKNRALDRQAVEQARRFGPLRNKLSQ